MKKTLHYVASLVCAAGISPAHAGMAEACPSDLVNFWKTFAVTTDNYAAIPVFLLENQCFRAMGVSSAFQEAMSQRLDHPDDPRYVDELYAQLDWAKPSRSATE